MQAPPARRIFCSACRYGWSEQRSGGRVRLQSKVSNTDIKPHRTTNRLAEELGLDNHWDVGEFPLTKHLEVTGLCDVDHRGLATVLLVLRGLAYVLGHKSPQALDVEHRAVLRVALQVEVPHANLTKVTRVAVHIRIAIIPGHQFVSTRVTHSARARKPKSEFPNNQASSGFHASAGWGIKCPLGNLHSLNQTQRTRTICRKGSGGGAGHQRYHAHQGATCACQYGHGRHSRARASCGSCGCASASYVNSRLWIDAHGSVREQGETGGKRKTTGQHTGKHN